MSKIVITRPKEWINRFRKYKLKLDGKEIDAIKNDEILEMKVAPGKHVLLAAIDWTTSNTYEFDIAEGETLYIKISAFKHANWLMPATSILFLLYITVFRNKFDLKDTLWEKAYWVILIFSVALFFYHLTIGRKRYLWLRKN